ncbi:MAG TPA: hypothetical protein VGQ73_08265 [Gemmatimonadales bacterium]|jgi:hypothetical protein|nr:hypothetical protein [Gemmatimonadales bacterium]
MLRTRQETEEALEIIDERGTPVGRVTHPIEARLFGPDRGTVYLKRSPPATEAPQGPSRAA